MEGSSPERAIGSPATEMLTPRSKVQKMLDDIDNAPTPSPQARIQPAASPLSPQRISSLELDDEDLYSATPMRPERHAREMSGSPIGSDAGSTLFVSTAKSVQDESGDELPSNPFGGKEKLAQLVAKKREQRLQREAEERQANRAQEKASRKRLHHRSSSAAPASSDLPEEAFEGSQDAVNPDIERIMSDAARPTRKASKKALLEMERETQRLARQQALAHQMKVKKKFTTSDLLAKFNFRQPQQQAGDDEPNAAEVTTASSSAPNSDGVDVPDKEPVSTPPSSPPTAGPTPLDKQRAIVEIGALSKLVPVREDSLTNLAQLDDDGDETLPDISDILRASQMPKPKALVFESVLKPSQQDRKGLKLARLGKAAARPLPNEDSEDDLEIVAPLPPHLRAFERAYNKPGKGKNADSKAIHNLKHLSNIGAYGAQPSKKGARPSVGPKTLETQLRRRAKEQARVQQQERIAELKAKGIDIQTTEEREREAEVFENLLEKAREEAAALRKAEKAAAKGEDGEAGQALDVSDDEEEDEDYVASGSEEDAGEPANQDGLVDVAAEETDEDEIEVLDGDASDSGSNSDEEPENDVLKDDAQETGAPEVSSLFDQVTTPALATRKPRQSRVIRDDSDSDAYDEQEDVLAAEPDQPAHDAEDPFAAFNFGANHSSDSLMSPTQAFHATMQTPTQATQEDSFDILRRIAPPSASSLPPTLFTLDDETQETQQAVEDQLSVVPSSQVPESQRITLAWETQPAETAPETPLPAGLQRGGSALTETPGWEPTQDGGLPSPWITRGLQREVTVESEVAEYETQSTVKLRVSESPIAAATAPSARRGKLMRRQAAILADSDSDNDEPAVPTKAAKTDAFGEMARRRREALTAGERAEAAREMKEMLEEQAEESEDEYAGIGGDDFVAPETEQDREMIDSSHIDVDERALAAHYAERERVRNEEETNKLFKDLTTGALRRKQANAWGLEEDEDEIAARRRQMRLLEEARKRKLLLQDDNIAGLAQGRQSKGKDAFLKAIADDEDGDDGLEDLSAGEEEDSQQTDSQPATRQQPSQAPLQEVSGNKRRLAEGEERSEDRPPAKLRRTQASAFRMPASLVEVRESVSFLLDDPTGPVSAQVAELEDGSENEEDPEEQSGEEDEEEEEAARQNDGGFAPNPANFDARAMPPPRLPASQRRTAAPKAAVVDRLSLKRGSSTSAATATGRTAWAASTTSGFKPPSLLRRATTNMSSAANDRGVTIGNGSAALSRENSGVKMGGSKKSSLAYQARAEERKAIVEASARRKEESTARIAQMRRNSSMLGRGLTGRFE